MEENNEQLIAGMNPNTYVGLMNLAFLVPSFGWIISIIMWVVGKDQSEYVNAKGKDLLNWIISVMIYSLGISIVVIIMAIILNILAVIAVCVSAVGLGLFVIICPIIAGVKAINNQDWNYPLTIQLIK